MSPRIARSNLSTYSYFHICCRGIEGNDLFIEEQDYCRYLTKLEHYRKEYSLNCFAYCLMSNHTHLLILFPSINILSKFMHRLGTSYSMYFNRRYKRKGHLFQNRFSSWIVSDESHLLKTKEYIEDNPVKAGLIDKKENYLWNSCSKRRDIPSVTITELKSYRGLSLHLH